jgi:hypothetical protein
MIKEKSALVAAIAKRTEGEERWRLKKGWREFLVPSWRIPPVFLSQCPVELYVYSLLERSRVRLRFVLPFFTA